MKIKLDENLGSVCAEVLRNAGHDVVSVHDQGMCSAPDRSLIEVCKSEGRCLVTLDLDFANPLLFQASDYMGIAVLRLPPKPDHGDLTCCLETLIRALVQETIRGKLWIVQRNRIRKYQPDN